MTGVNSSPTRAGGDLDEIRSLVSKKVESYDPKKDNDEELEFDTDEELSIMQIVSRFMECTDRFLWWSGHFCAAIFGASMPAFCLIFGQSIDAAGAGSEGFDDMKEQALWMVGIGLIVWLTSFAQVSMLQLFAQRMSFKVQIRYFEACLQQDADFYDVNSPASMASKIAKECSAIQRGFGEKVGMLTMSVISFFSSFAFSFFWGWKFTLILFATFPVLALVGVAMAVSMESGQKEQMAAYAQSAGYAEQALTAIKVVHTYGQERLENGNYFKYLDRAKQISDSLGIKIGLGSAIFYSIMFLFYAYGFYFGGLLRLEGVERPNGELYTGGVILAIIFSVLFGTMTLTGVGPHLRGVTDGKIGGKLAFDVINNKPKVNPTLGGEKVDKATAQGVYEFKNVEFKYPMRDDLKILSDFSCLFEKGKTTALVGPSGSGKSTIIQLMERFYDATAGEVLFDGKNIKNLDIRSLRRVIGYVGQEPVLFNTTIRENMKFAVPEATDEEIIEALKAANAWDFVSKKMTKGIDTQVGGAGGQLSGGQK